MMLMVFDAATPGRLSFIEHRTMATTKYLEQIRKWHESCAWVHANFRDGECCYYVGVPGIKRIIDAVYGTEDKGVLKLRKNNLYPAIHETAFTLRMGWKAAAGRSGHECRGPGVHAPVLQQMVQLGSACLLSPAPW